MRLSELKPGETGVITKILGHGAFRKRVMEMGFVRCREVRVVLNAPLHDPVKYALMDYEVSLRRAEADLIEVDLLENWEASHVSADALTEEHDKEASRELRKDKIINVALIGNPNCGKTSLFNRVSGAHEHVGNYAGVTVGAKAGTLKHKGYRMNIVDLPGTYSLSAYSPEELYVMRYLREETPDVIINVVVASNLERNLYLTTELIDMNRSMVIDLNMFDELKRSGVSLDYSNLGKMLGVPVVPTIAATGYGVDNLLDTVIEVYEMKNPDTRHIHVKMNPEIESAVNKLKDEFKNDLSVAHQFSPRFLAIKFLEKDPEIEDILKHNPNYEIWKQIRDDENERIHKELHEDVSSAIAAEKYGFIQGALKENMEGSVAKEEKSTKIIDAFVTNKLFGFPLFLIVMWLMFWATFQIGSYPMEWIERLVAWISGLVSKTMADGPFKDLLLDGIIGGVGGVIVFLPNILILYAFISFMEDSGYMARVAFIMDKLMHRMGLHGKSFIPLVMGFGCNVPAIMSTRIIESKSSRLITILINPFISCSARIPIYVLLVGAFFPDYGAWVFVSLYTLGIAIAVLTAKLMRKFWFKADETPFVMELPPYRMPTMKATIRNMWSKAEQYLRKMGGLILVASIIIWALSYFPHYETEDLPKEYVAATLAEMPADQTEGMSQSQIEKSMLTEYQQSNSILGKIGQFVEPVVRPMELGWKSCVSLIAGSAAKEVVVSTLGVLYVGDDDAELLTERLQSPSRLTGKTPFTPASALAFMVFVLLYFPCIATLTAIARETGSWKYALFSVIYNTGLAWVFAFLTYRIAVLF
ncbi:MAG: ferrous iron transport protein B [Muribaculaceae bacterium]|jgi:ferrous iron transport protein B|uniref:ferrous iron transport protein B n=2 Tax=Bacteroidales TaxID=171549 RepID=UPI000F51AC37|nr:ferrous iron transport protein B [Sangeribacter muris]MBJ2193558.1 ferrous iron transport protein B [Muribaculaceae bacterium]MCX4280267.1 ferrous iron transport protein B [Muribaculaceae bacterium]ROS81954.1 ferrous iron transport protein B [Muribaculaceae bacterium Isolate-036 (Harlan)]